MAAEVVGQGESSSQAGPATDGLKRFADLDGRVIKLLNSHRFEEAYRLSRDAWDAGVAFGSGMLFRMVLAGWLAADACLRAGDWHAWDARLRDTAQFEGICEGEFADSPYVLHILALVRADLGHDQEAIATLERALDIPTDDAEVRARLVRMLDRLRHPGSLLASVQGTPAGGRIRVSQSAQRSETQLDGPTSSRFCAAFCACATHPQETECAACTILQTRELLQDEVLVAGRLQDWLVWLASRRANRSEELLVTLRLAGRLMAPADWQSVRRDLKAAGVDTRIIRRDCAVCKRNRTTSLEVAGTGERIYVSGFVGYTKHAMQVCEDCGPKRWPAFVRVVTASQALTDMMAEANRVKNEAGRLQDYLKMHGRSDPSAAMIRAELAQVRETLDGIRQQRRIKEQALAEAKEEFSALMAELCTSPG